MIPGYTVSMKPGLLSGRFCASFNIVDHLCEKCGAPVEDRRPFCVHCRAPQIHVQVATPADGPDSTSDASSGAPLLIPQGADFSRSATPQQSPSDRGVATRSALKAGALGIFLGTIPFVGILLTGWLAVYFYKRQKGVAPRTSRGAQLGGAAGVVVSAINAVFTIAIIVSHAQQQCVDKFVEVAQKLGINTQTPEFQASMSGLFTPSGIVSSFVVALVLASVGGAMAAILLRRPPRA
jgi:hypothetical protein